MRKVLVPTIAVLALSTAPAFGQTEPVPTPPCPTSPDYVTVGLEGKEEAIDSPLLPNSAKPLGEPFASMTTESRFYRIDISGSATKPFATKANVSIDLTWVNDGDFELYVYDAEGSLLGSSTDFVQDYIESVTVSGAAQCTDLRVDVENYLAPPDVDMKLTTKIGNLKP